MSPKDKSSKGVTRREVLSTAARGGAFLGLGCLSTLLAVRAHGSYAWEIDPSRCINSRLGAVGIDVCGACATDCVLSLSAIRAVNTHRECGRCYICPSYFQIKSAIGPDGLPSQKLCPRDAIERKEIGWVDPDDPANNFYEYVIKEELCNGCGQCIMACKEPAGLGSIRLEVRHDVCVDCNSCSISIACPEDAYLRQA